MAKCLFAYIFESVGERDGHDFTCSPKCSACKSDDAFGHDDVGCYVLGVVVKVDDPAVFIPKSLALCEGFFAFPEGALAYVIKA